MSKMPNASKVSNIIDGSTSMTENDILRLLKGCICRNQYANAIYCLDVLEHSTNYFERVYRMVVLLFFELGIANDFPDLCADLLKVNDFTELRSIVIRMCCRDNNAAAFMPDMLARITGYNREITLTSQEAIGHLQYPVLMERILNITKEQTPFVQQCFIAVVFNLLTEDKNLGYLPGWYAVRCARLGILLAGAAGADIFWSIIRLLPTFYRRWRTMGPWIENIVALYERISVGACEFSWDKRRAIVASVLCGVLFGIQDKSEMSQPEEQFSSRPELFPEWFYSTQEAPPLSSKILFRSNRPDTPESYLKKKYPRYDIMWASLYKEMLDLIRKEVIDRSEMSMRFQTRIFKEHLANSYFDISEQSPARRMHCFITDGAIRSSCKNPVNACFLNLRYIARDQAGIMPSSVLVHNGPFAVKYGKMLTPRAIDLTIMATGPFCQAALIVRLLCQLTILTHLGTFQNYPLLEPFLHTQRDGATILFMIQNCFSAVTDAEIESSADLKRAWTYGWLTRYLLTQSSVYDPCDFVCFQSGVLWLSGFYPDDRAFSEEECIGNLMRHSNLELYSECMMSLEKLIDETHYSVCLDRVLPRPVFHFVVYKSEALGYRSIIARRYHQLCEDLPVQAPPVEIKSAKKHKKEKKKEKKKEHK